MGKVRMRRSLGWFLLLLFFFPPSPNPSQNFSLVSGYYTVVAHDQEHNISNGETRKNELITKIALGKEVRVDRHSVGGHGGGNYAGGGGNLNSQPAHESKKGKPPGRGANGCSTDHIHGLTRLAFLLFPSVFLVFLFHGF